MGGKSLENNKDFNMNQLENIVKKKSIKSLKRYIKKYLNTLESNNKKLVFVVDTEQNALKFQNDLKNLFDINALIFPYQDGFLFCNHRQEKQILFCQHFLSR